ncbi:FecR domain-containing protein [Mucilaginibacter yixingensis]|nr:FecR family protein [Mucilaginibacter yixingensis]
MNQDRLDYLLDQYHNGICSPDEQAELDNWYHNLKGGKPDFEAWVNEQGGEEQLTDTLYQNFQQKLQQNKKRSRFAYSGWVAASVVIALISGYFLFKTNKQIPQTNTVAQVKAPAGQPGKNKAFLTLADGRKIDLDDTRPGQLAQQQGVVIHSTSGGKIIYQMAGNQKAAAKDTLAWNNITIPRAGQYELELPDGTKVWLNAETSLRFPVQFQGKERRVMLTGEAYFEVAHNASMPFKVSTGSQTVTVLGTHFNIKAYADEEKMSTTLLQGSVSIANSVSGQSKLLVPGKQADIYKGNGAIAISNAKVDEVIAWKNGYFIFDNQDIRSIMKLVSRWYDVDVNYQINKPVRFGGTFSRSSNLNELLKNFALISNLHFDVKERRIIVSN